MREWGKESSYMIIHFARKNGKKLRTHAPPSPIPPPTVPATLLRAAGLFRKIDERTGHLLSIECAAAAAAAARKSS